MLPCWPPCATVDAFITQAFMPTPLPRLVVGIPEDTRQQLRALAATHHRSISGEVIAALEYWIAANATTAKPLNWYQQMARSVKPEEVSEQEGR